MQDIGSSENPKEELIELIRRIASEDPDPATFLQHLQIDIEALPGATVTFAGRTVAHLDELGYFADRGDLTLEQKQAALFGASTQYSENSATQDGITYDVDRMLDEHHPREDSEMTLRPR